MRVASIGIVCISICLVCCYVNDLLYFRKGMYARLPVHSVTLITRTRIRLHAPLGYVLCVPFQNVYM